MVKKIGRNEPCPCKSGKKYKKCCMEKNQRNPKDTFNIFFGEDWIDNKMSKVKLSGFKDLNPMNVQAMHLHPLIEAIVGTQRKLFLSSESKSPIVYGWHEAFQDLTHHVLTSLENNIDFNLTKRRLKDEDEFDKVFYELFIASGYKRNGCEIEIISTTSDKRTGEFYVKHSSGNILVECKKKDIRSDNEKRVDNWWVTFQHLMMKQLKEANKYFGIFIDIPKEANEKEIPLVIDEIIEIIKKHNDGRFSVLNNKYNLEITSFCENGEDSTDATGFYGFSKKFNVDACISRCLQNRSLNADTVKEPFVICCRAFNESIDSKVNAILSTIAQAYGQLEDDIPNIVYVDTNIATMLSDKIDILFKRLKPAITTKLDRDFSKISAIVLTNFRFMKPVTDGCGVYCIQDLIINPHANFKIPEDFRVYGDVNGGIDILRDIYVLTSR